MKARVLLGLVLLVAAGVEAQEVLRPPIAAGAFYPDKADALLSTMRGFYSEAAVEPEAGRLVACIVPHSGYEFSGAVAAHAFKDLQPGQYSRVVILAPSHFTSFEACSIPAVTGYVTPLGIVPLDGEAIARLTYSPLFTTRGLRYRRGDNTHMLHETEHDIEVLLPFLQERLGLFQLVPILIGNLRDVQARYSENVFEVVADAIREIVDESTLIVVSSDFTHFGNDFSYRPFNDNILARIQELDQTAFRLIVSRDTAGFRSFLEQTRSTICGRESIQVMLKLLPPRTAGRLLAYDQSSRKTNNVDRCVTYAAITFHDPTKPARPARPAPNPFAVPQAQVPGFGPGTASAPLAVPLQASPEGNHELRQ